MHYFRYDCFVNPDCLRCAQALDFHGNRSKLDVLNSSACSAALGEPSLLLSVRNTCRTYYCNYFKHQCSKSEECLQCWQTLQRGDGAGAARQCKRTSTAGALMDQLVHGCLGTSDAGCSYALQRCTDAGPCGECVAMINNGNNARSVAQSLSSPSCTAALNASDFPGTMYMVDFTCSQVGSCLSAVTAYVRTYHDRAISCYFLFWG